MSVPEGFYDLLFEISNEYRHGILLLLQKGASRITDIAKGMNLNNPEIRRHVSRLQEVGLIQRDANGYYHLTPYGETSLLLLQEFEFLITNRDYFKNHTLSKIPPGFIKRIGELAASVNLTNPVDFFRYTESLFNQSKGYVWLLVDQFPLNSLSTIVKAIDRGVELRIIEPMERVFNPDLGAMTSEETKALSRTRYTPLVEERMTDEIKVYLLVSDSRCVVMFPTSNHNYDYMGFTATDDVSITWCRELFEHYWDEAEQRTIAPIKQVKSGQISGGLEPREQVIVVGREIPEIDAQSVQDAVDNYDKVILRGTFNFGTSSVMVSRSVIIKGEGRVNDVPSTIIYKKGWSFPFREFTGIFELIGNGIDVSIENLYFTDFNCTSVMSNTEVGTGTRNSVKFLNNRVTIRSGYGHGQTFAAFGDFLWGVLIEAIGDGGVLVEGNYIDLAHRGDFGGGIWRGALSRGGLEEDPEYRPDLFNHEYFVGYGIVVNSCSGKVKILNNVVRNASGKGIATSDHLKPIDVVIRGNLVESDVYGSYPMSSPESAAGISVHTGLEGPKKPGFSVYIEENTIKLERLNHSGVVVLGPSNDESGKLSGAIRHNDVQLGNGYEGIHVRKCDDFQVTNNRISGKAYYGIRLSGRKASGRLDLCAVNNNVEDNDMGGLAIKGPDKYSNNHADGRMFAHSLDVSATANLWFNLYTKCNSVSLKRGESVIDEGENNSIMYV